MNIFDRYLNDKLGYASVVGRQIPTTALRRSTLVKQHQQWLNYLGEEVLNNKLLNVDRSLTIDVSKLDNGVYLLHLLSTTGVLLENSKFIISK